MVCKHRLGRFYLRVKVPLVKDILGSSVWSRDFLRLMEQQPEQFGALETVEIL